MGSQSTTRGRAIQAARIAAGYSRTELAAVLTRDPQTVSRWESGTHNPSQAVLLRLAALFDVDPAKLVD